VIVLLVAMMLLGFNVSILCLALTVFFCRASCYATNNYIATGGAMVSLKLNSFTFYLKLLVSSQPSTLFYCDKRCHFIFNYNSLLTMTLMTVVFIASLTVLNSGGEQVNVV